MKFAELMTSLEEGGKSQAITAMTIDAGIRLAFINAATIQPEILRAVFAQIENDTLSHFNDSPEDIRKAVIDKFEEIKTGVFSANEQYFKEQ